MDRKQVSGQSMEIEWIPTDKSVKQECILFPCLFNLCFLKNPNLRPSELTDVLTFWIWLIVLCVVQIIPLSSIHPIIERIVKMNSKYSYFLKLKIHTDSTIFFVFHHIRKQVMLTGWLIDILVFGHCPSHHPFLFHTGLEQPLS